MKHILKLTFVVVVTLLLASCGSNRWMERSPRVGGLSGKAYTEKVIELSPNWECVTGKVALALDMGAKGTTKVNATLRMKRGGSDSVFGSTTFRYRSGTYGDIATRYFGA